MVVPQGAVLKRAFRAAFPGDIIHCRSEDFSPLGIGFHHWRHIDIFPLLDIVEMQQGRILWFRSGAQVALDAMFVIVMLMIFFRSIKGRCGKNLRSR